MNRPFGIGDFVASFKGDTPGHPFRGNQYEGGSGEGGSSKYDESSPLYSIEKKPAHQRTFTEQLAIESDNAKPIKIGGGSGGQTSVYGLDTRQRGYEWNGKKLRNLGDLHKAIEIDHKKKIKDAIKKGESVPDEVFNDYPDLK